MKHLFYIAAAALAMAMIAGVATAGSVDIGLGRMDQAEFYNLKQMVSGDHQPSASVSTPIPRDTQVAEFNQADVDDIRQAMAAGGVQSGANESLANNGMVDIGTGAMATNEFCDLNRLVASNTTDQNSGFTFICP